jgi:hypothetical protein
VSDGDVRSDEANRDVECRQLRRTGSRREDRSQSPLDFSRTGHRFAAHRDESSVGGIETGERSCVVVIEGGSRLCNDELDRLSIGLASERDVSFLAANESWFSDGSRACFEYRSSAPRASTRR